VTFGKALANKSGMWYTIPYCTCSEACGQGVATIFVPVLREMKNGGIGFPKRIGLCTSVG